MTCLVPPLLPLLTALPALSLFSSWNSFFRHVHHCDSLPHPLGSADVWCQPPSAQCSHIELSLSPPWPSLSAFSSDTLWSGVNYMYFVTSYLKMLLCSISLSLISPPPPFTNASLELQLYGTGLSSVQFTVGFLCLEICLAHMHRQGSLGEGMNKGWHCGAVGTTACLGDSVSFTEEEVDAENILSFWIITLAH